MSKTKYKPSSYDPTATNMEVVRLMWCEALLQTAPAHRVSTEDIMKKFKCSIASARNTLLTYRRINGDHVHYTNRSGEMSARNEFEPKVAKSLSPEHIIVFVDALTDEEVVTEIKESKDKAA